MKFTATFLLAMASALTMTSAATILERGTQKQSCVVDHECSQGQVCHILSYTCLQGCKTNSDCSDKWTCGKLYGTSGPTCNPPPPDFNGGFGH